MVIFPCRFHQIHHWLRQLVEQLIKASNLDQTRRSFVQSNSKECPLRHRVSHGSFLERSQFETRNFCNCSRCLRKRKTFPTVQTSQMEIMLLFAWNNLTLEQKLCFHPSTFQVSFELHFWHLEFWSWLYFVISKNILSISLANISSTCLSPCSTARSMNGFAFVHFLAMDLRNIPTGIEWRSARPCNLLIGA